MHFVVVLSENPDDLILPTTNNHDLMSQQSMSIHSTPSHIGLQQPQLQTTPNNNNTNITPQTMTTTAATATIITQNNQQKVLSQHLPAMARKNSNTPFSGLCMSSFVYVLRF